MKKSLLFWLLFFYASTNFTVLAQAKATASFTASATIITPIGITTLKNMNFANLDAKSGGAVILTPENTRVSAGGVDLDEATDVSAATFEITGQHNFSFSITLPQNDYELINGSESMVINNFTSSIAETGGGLDGSSKIVKVGATLNVNPGQAPGIYTSAGQMNVTVNYN